MNCYSPNFQIFILMKNALNNQVGMLGDMFLWLVVNLKQGNLLHKTGLWQWYTGISVIKHTCVPPFLHLQLCCVLAFSACNHKIINTLKHPTRLWLKVQKSWHLFTFGEKWHPCIKLCYSWQIRPTLTKWNKVVSSYLTRKSTFYIMQKIFPSRRMKAMYSIALNSCLVDTSRSIEIVPRNSSTCSSKKGVRI